MGISGTNDPILDMAMTTFMSLMMLAAQIDSKDEERQKGFISAMAANRYYLSNNTLRQVRRAQF